MVDKKYDKVRAIRKGVEIVSPEDEDKLPPPNIELIECLEALLEEAREGMLQEIAFACLYADYTSLSHFVGNFDNPSSLVGEVEVLKHNYLVSRHPNVLLPMIMEMDE